MIFRNVIKLWRFPETTVVGNRVNSVDVRSKVEGVRSTTVFWVCHFAYYVYLR